MQEQPKPQQKIRLADNLPGAEYANVMQVNHNKDEFMMMFANIAGPTGRVVSKIIATPGHMKRIVAVLQDNVRKYESRFGKIEEAEAPKDNLGFNTG